MDKSIQITLIIVGAVILLALLGGYAFFQLVPTGSTVSVQGNSQIKAMPDIVSIYISVDTKGDTSKIANDKNSEIVDNILTSLVKQGFERKDIVTQNFNIYPDQVWQNNQYVTLGYRAVHELKVEISTSDSGKIGDVIDAAVNNGASISYINFELSQDKQNEYKAQALKDATTDAKTKAQGMADGLGKRLGKIVSISNNDFSYQPWRMYDTVTAGNAPEAKSATANIQPGQQDINAQVSVVYRIV
jgi:uncharacterized protein